MALDQGAVALEADAGDEQQGPPRPDRAPSAILPFYVTALYGGWRSIRALWPMLLVAGVSFGLTQFAASNYLDYTLTDVFAALGSLAVTLLFLQFWNPAPDPEFAISHSALETSVPVSRPVPAWQGWVPWLIVTVIVVVW